MNNTVVQPHYECAYLYSYLNLTQEMKTELIFPIIVFKKLIGCQLIKGLINSTYFNYASQICILFFWMKFFRLLPHINFIPPEIIFHYPFHLRFSDDLENKNWLFRLNSTNISSEIRRRYIIYYYSHKKNFISNFMANQITNCFWFFLYCSFWSSFNCIRSRLFRSFWLYLPLKF